MLRRSLGTRARAFCNGLGAHHRVTDIDGTPRLHYTSRNGRKPWTPPKNALGKSVAPRSKMAAYAGCVVARWPLVSQYGGHELALATVGVVLGTGRSSPSVPNAHRLRANPPGHARGVAALSTTSGDCRHASTFSVARRAARRRKPQERALHGRRAVRGKPVPYAKRVLCHRASMRCFVR